MSGDILSHFQTFEPPAPATQRAAQCVHDAAGFRVMPLFPSKEFVMTKNVTQQDATRKLSETGKIRLGAGVGILARSGASMGASTAEVKTAGRIRLGAGVGLLPVTGIQHSAR
jgi:hypothetical protein